MKKESKKDKPAKGTVDAADDLLLDIEREPDDDDPDVAAVTFDMDELEKLG